jgi:hypothetical protein
MPSDDKISNSLCPGKLKKSMWMQRKRLKINLVYLQSLWGEIVIWHISAENLHTLQKVRHI